MGQVIETGHAINISNYKFLIDKCTEFGVKYNPSNADLTIAKMTTQWTTADTAHQTLTTAIQNSKGPINDREILFNPVDKLVTRTYNYFKSTKASNQIKQDAKGLADRYRGFKAKVGKLPDGAADPSDVSKSHQSYVQKADTFKQLIELYRADANYAPNKTDLKLVALDTLWGNMKTMNDNIGTILAPVETARETRDKTLYEEGVGIIDTSLACKDYVKGLYGVSSTESKQVSKIKFTRIKKRK